jgi:hypothetical protein
MRELERSTPRQGGDFGGQAMYELVILFDSGRQVVAGNFAHPQDAVLYARLEWPGRKWEAQYRQPP